MTLEAGFSMHGNVCGQQFGSHSHFLGAPDNSEWAFPKVIVILFREKLRQVVEFD